MSEWRAQIIKDTLDSWTALVVAVGVALGAVAKIMQAFWKRRPPRAVGITEEMARLRTDIASARAEAAAARAEVDQVRTDLLAEIGAVRRDLRDMTDYAHDLRADYARDAQKPPRDWPEGLKQ